MKLDASVIAAEVSPVLSGFSEIVAAYLFGSAAAGQMRPDSDVDIAILLDQESNIDRKKILESLLPRLCRPLRADVHLLILNDASYLVRSQVLNKGRLIYVKNSRQLALFRMKSVVFFAEFAPYMHQTRKGFQNRIRRKQDA